MINNFIFELLTYVMVMDFYMLCVRMEFQVTGKGNCQLIVDENRDGTGRMKT